MIMTLSEACNVLHVDEGANDELIVSLIEAIPDYIEVATGYPAVEQSTEPLVRVMLEGEDIDEITAMARDLADLIENRLVDQTV